MSDIKSLNGYTLCDETAREALQSKIGSDELNAAVNTALSQAKASGQFDGADGKDGAAGKDGVSPTVSTSKSGKVTTLTITDANGTKTAKINDGADGAKGADGTSVTVSKVTESSADGGSNVVTFSDGKTVTVKNGSKGSTGVAGKTPVKGTDYFTEADKTEIAGLAAGMVEIPVSYVAQGTAPSDTSVLWVDTSDEDDGGFQSAVDAALAQAKASGEFDGKDGTDGKNGADGKTPVKGADYFTAADKAEMVNAVIAALPVYAGEVV